MARGVVVLCTVDGLTQSELAALPKTAAQLGGAARPLDPLSAERAHFALGTGKARLDARGALLALLEQGELLRAPALDRLLAKVESEPGTFVDFMTQQERHRCRLHVFCLSSERADQARSTPVVALSDELVRARIPFAVHVVLDAPNPAGAELLDQLEPALGDQGVIATLLGADHACDATLDLDRAVSTHRAVVRAHDGDTCERPRDALVFVGQSGQPEPSLPPTRVADYAGVTGNMMAEFGEPSAGGEGPKWEWRGNDVALLAVESAVALRPLAALLLREGLPAEVAAGFAMHGRDVRAFDRATLATLGGAGPLGLPSVLSTACPTPSLKIRLDASGKRVATAVQAPLVDLATFSFEGEPASGARAANVLPSASEVVAAAQADVEAGAADLVHLAVMLPASEEGRAALDEALAALAQRAAEREGSLVLVGTGSFAAAQGALSLDDVDTHDELHGAVLEALGVAAEDDASVARRLRRRR